MDRSFRNGCDYQSTGGAPGTQCGPRGTPISRRLAPACRVGAQLSGSALERLGNAKRCVGATVECGGGRNRVWRGGLGCGERAGPQRVLSDALRLPRRACLQVQVVHPLCGARGCHQLVVEVDEPAGL